MKATGTYTVKKWDEKIDKEVAPEMKTTKASVEYVFAGEADGLASVEYLMFYIYYDAKDQLKSLATFVGLLQFTGSISGKAGSFFVADNGIFENGSASSTLRIINESGLGELRQISGTGHYVANQNGYRYEFDYNL